MEFYINKNSTLPILKLELINDGRNDFNRLQDKIQNANITFTMTDVITGVKRIAKKPTYPMQIEPENCIGPEFYLTYRFSEKDTGVAGRYIGKFEITFEYGFTNENEIGLLIVPIKEELFINILDGSIKK
jgi:hypothetical protein